MSTVHSHLTFLFTLYSHQSPRHVDGTLPPHLSLHSVLISVITSCRRYTPTSPFSSLCIDINHHSRALLSSSETLLKIPKHSLKSVGARSFSLISLSVWNSQSASLRNLPALSGFETFSFRHASVDLGEQCLTCMDYVCVCVYV